jgi:hypothetical protein
VGRVGGGRSSHPPCLCGGGYLFPSPPLLFLFLPLFFTPSTLPPFPTLPSLLFFPPPFPKHTTSMIRSIQWLASLLLTSWVATVRGLRPMDPLYHFNSATWPSVCPMPYTVSVIYQNSVSMSGDTFSTGDETILYGTGTLELPNVLNSPLGFVDLNSIASFVDPVTGSLTSYASKRSSGLWPDLNLAFQLAVPVSFASGSLKWLYLHDSGLPSVEWEPAGATLVASEFSGHTICYYLGRIQNLAVTYTTDLRRELTNELFTLTGEGIFNASYGYIYEYDVSDGNVYVSKHTGYKVGMKNVRTSSAVLIAYDATAQAILNQLTPQPPWHATQNYFRPMVYCMNDWGGINCNVPLMFEPITGGTCPHRCCNLAPGDGTSADFGTGCAYNFTPYRQYTQGASTITNTDFGALPGALQSLASSCAALAYRRDHQDKLWNNVFPFVYQDSLIFTSEQGNCNSGETRGTVDMAPEYTAANVATHLCTKFISDGRVYEVPITILIDNADITIMGMQFCNPGKCVCNSAYGGTDCSVKKLSYCDSSDSSSNLVFPNPFDPSTKYLGDPRLRISDAATTTISSLVQLDLSVPVSGDTSSTSFFANGGDILGIYNVFSPSTNGFPNGVPGSFNSTHTFADAASKKISFQPHLVASFPAYSGSSAYFVERDPYICSMQNVSSDICAGQPESCQWDLDGATNPARQASPNTNRIGCIDCGYPYFGRTCGTTCTSPVCVPHFMCVNSGGENWAVYPGAFQLSCVCEPHYTDAYPATAGTLENCVTCLNEVNSDTPTCGGHGSCPTGSWSGPPAALKCDCDSGYVDESCTLPSTTLVTCGSQSIVFNCTFQGKGSLSAFDYRYTCQASTTLWTATSPNQGFPVTFYCPNVPSTLTCSDIRAACILPTADQDATVPTDPCPLPFHHFAGIGQSPTNFCDPPMSIQSIKGVVYADSFFCYLHTRIDPGPGLYPYVGKYRCLTSPINATLFGSCDVLVDYTHASALTARDFARLVMPQCMTGGS